MNQNCCFTDFTKQVADLLKINHMETSLSLKYQVRDGYPAIKIDDDQSLGFYMDLKSREVDYTKFPVCVIKEQINTLVPVPLLISADHSEVAGNEGIVAALDFDLDYEDSKYMNFMDFAREAAEAMSLAASSVEQQQITYGAVDKTSGQMQLKTNNASVLEINASCEENNQFRQWLRAHDKHMNLLEMSMKQRMKDVEVVILHQILFNRDELNKEKYYSFKGYVDKVMNKSSLWYESCKNCATAVVKTDNGMSCKKCNSKIEEPTPRYRLVLNVVADTHNATITLFEEAAMVYIGCPINDYIRSIEQSTFEFQFLIPVDSKSFNSRREFNAVAEAIARTNDEEMNDNQENSLQSPTGLDVDKGNSSKRTTIRKKRSINKIIEDENDSVVEVEDHETISSIKKKCARKSTKAKGRKPSVQEKVQKQKEGNQLQSSK
ncbi:Unknown protein [Striga hermonthica]|uniref:Replication factor A C-terminal domain-containing protein n=1 Tax=Striga hermonthica TaxID=68872 RepID=A0A9N7N2N8_STRHE|nr:Unknown protein [Striga hermonthica]